MSNTICLKHSSLNEFYENIQKYINLKYLKILKITKRIKFLKNKERIDFF